MQSLLPHRLAAISLATFMPKATHCSQRASANLLAAAVWEPSWVNQRVLCKSDNMAVVAVLSTRSAKDPLLMHLLSCLFFYAAHYHFTQYTQPIPLHLPTGSANTNSHPGSHRATGSHEQTRLDIQKLETAIHFYFKQGIAQSTERPYGSAQ